MTEELSISFSSDRPFPDRRAGRGNGQQAMQLSLKSSPEDFHYPFSIRTYLFPSQGQLCLDSSTSGSLSTLTIDLCPGPRRAPFHLNLESPFLLSYLWPFSRWEGLLGSSQVGLVMVMALQKAASPSLEVTSLYTKDIISPFILKCLSALLLTGCKSARVACAWGVFIMKIQR